MSKQLRRIAAVGLCSLSVCSIALLLGCSRQAHCVGGQCYAPGYSPPPRPESGTLSGDTGDGSYEVSPSDFSDLPAVSPDHTSTDRMPQGSGSR